MVLYLQLGIIVRIGDGLGLGFGFVQFTEYLGLGFPIGSSILRLAMSVGALGVSWSWPWDGKRVYVHRC